MPWYRVLYRCIQKYTHSPAPLIANRFKWNTPYAPHTSIEYVTWPPLPGTPPLACATAGWHVNASLHVRMCACVHEELVIFRSTQCVFHPQLPDHCSVFRLFFSPALLYPVFCINCLLPRCLCGEQNVSVAQAHGGGASTMTLQRCYMQANTQVPFSVVIKCSF